MVIEKIFICEECYVMVCLEEGYKVLNYRKCIYMFQIGVFLNIF